MPEAVGGPAALVLVNDDDLTYAKVRLDPGSLATVARAAGRDPGAAEPGARLVRAVERVRDAELPASDYLDVAFGQVGREPAADLLDTVLGEIGAAIDDYLPPAQRAAARSRFVATCRGGLQDAASGLGRAAHLGPAPHPRRGHERGRRRRGARPARRQHATRGPAGGPRPALGAAGWRWPRRTRRRPPSWTPRWPRTTR